MSIPSEVPRLPKLPFILADVVLLGVAGFIAYAAPAPLSSSALIAVVVLVALGAVALAIPFITDYGRKTDALLSERQDQIAALAQTTATSAEQLSIAAASLHSIGEAVTRSAKLLETLPHKLHEKIAELKAQLNEVSVTGDDALEQEVQTLRSAESDRLISAIDQLAATAKDLNRLETVTQAHAGRVAEAFAELPRMAEQAAAKAADGVSRSTTATRQDLEGLLSEHRNALAATAALIQAQSTGSLEANLARASVELDTAFSTFLGRLVAQTESANRAMDDKLTILSATSIRLERQLAEAAAIPPAPPPAPRKSRAPRGTPRADVPDTHVAAPSAPAAVDATAVASAAEAPPAVLNAFPTPVAPPEPSDIVAPNSEAESAVLSEKEPSRHASAAPEGPAAVATGAPAPSERAESATIASIPSTDTAKPVADVETTAHRHPVTRKPIAESRVAHVVTDELFQVEEVSGFDGDEPDGEESSALTLTADGATRLLVTAYIGIGNKLFLRGNGAGLNWEKGVPLQFVSIGKWRWESTEAALPLSARLYKNDQIECAAIGTFTLEPGRQRELTATF